MTKKKVELVVINPITLKKGLPRAWWRGYHRTQIRLMEEALIKAERELKQAYAAALRDGFTKSELR